MAQFENYGHWTEYDRNLTPDDPIILAIRDNPALPEHIKLMSIETLLSRAGQTKWMKNEEGLDWYEFQKTLPEAMPGDVYASVMNGHLMSVEDHWNKVMPLNMTFVRIFTDAPAESLRGCPFDLETGEIGEYPQQAEPLSALAFKELFTQEERLTMRRKAKEDELVEDWLDLLNASQNVQKSDPRTMEGLQYMVHLGLLTPARLQEILDAMPL